MNLIHTQSNGNSPWQILKRAQIRPGLMFGAIILAALLSFEIFNYSTTDYALRDLLGDLRFAGIHWATILSIAFCGIDFAGIARLFTPEDGGRETHEAWYLFGAWFLAATMNAILTWWGVAMAIVNHSVQSASVVDPATLTKVVPVFVALMVWVIRILIIGSLSYAGNRIFTDGRQPAVANRRVNNPSMPLSSPMPTPASLRNSGGMSPRAAASAAAPRANAAVAEPSMSGRPEPTYHSLSMSSRPGGSSGQGQGSPSQHF